MKEIFKEFYEPDYKQLWDECTFVFDSSVLLDLYRFSEKTRNGFVNALEQIKGRVWLPYQVGYEYHNNRKNVIESSKMSFSDAPKIIDKHFSNLENDLKANFERIKDSEDDSRDTFDCLAKSRKILEEQILKISNIHQSKYDKLNKKDIIQEKLTIIYKNKIGDEYSELELEEIYKEAECRFKRNVPPGYEDRDKEDNKKYSDYIIWKQIMNYSNEKKVPIIFVTSDMKKDWWNEVKGKKICCPVLKKEFHTQTKQEIHFYNAFSFLDYANDLFKLKYSEELIKEVKNVKRPLEMNLDIERMLKEREESTTIKTILKNLINFIQQNATIYYVSSKVHFLYGLGLSDGFKEILDTVIKKYNMTGEIEKSLLLEIAIYILKNSPEFNENENSIYAKSDFNI